MFYVTQILGCLGFFHQLCNTSDFRMKRKEEITCLSSKRVFSNALVSSSVLQVGEVPSLLFIAGFQVQAAIRSVQVNVL